MFRIGTLDIAGNSIWDDLTCNPHWGEMIENLLPHQAAIDRTDITSHAFNDSFIDDLNSGRAFGPILSYRISKRGLPHAHILLILENKISPDDYDNYVSAEVPCPTTQEPL
jgi:hypothetical protein